MIDRFHRPTPLAALVGDSVARVLMIFTNELFSCSQGRKRTAGNTILFFCDPASTLYLCLIYLKFYTILILGLLYEGKKLLELRPTEPGYIA